METTNMDFGVLKFNSKSNFSFDSLKLHRAYIIRKKINDKKALTREEKNYITEECHRCRDCANNGTYVYVMGWSIDFSDVLKGFVVKQYGEWHEYRAVDRTSLRTMLHGTIDKIINID